MRLENKIKAVIYCWLLFHYEEKWSYKIGFYWTLDQALEWR